MILQTRTRKRKIKIVELLIGELSQIQIRFIRFRLPSSLYELTEEVFG